MKRVILLCLFVSLGSWASNDPHKEMKDERYKYMKLYADEKRKQAEYEKEVPILKSMSNFYLSDKMLNVQNNYYKYITFSYVKNNSYYTQLFNKTYYTLTENDVNEKNYNLFVKRNNYLKKQIPLLKDEFVKSMHNYVKLAKIYIKLRDNRIKLINYAHKNLKYYVLNKKSYKVRKNYTFVQSRNNYYYEPKISLIYSNNNIKPILKYNLYSYSPFGFNGIINIPIYLVNGELMSPIITEVKENE